MADRGCICILLIHPRQQILEIHLEMLRLNAVETDIHLLIALTSRHEAVAVQSFIDSAK